MTINALTHDGLADLAVKASQDYDKAQTDEMNMLNDIDNMIKETVKNIEDGTVIPPAPDAPSVESVTLAVEGTPNGSIAKVIATVQPENAGVVSYKFEYKLSSETDYKLGQEMNSSNKSCNYTYSNLSQEVVNNLKVTATDNKGNTKESIIDVTPDAPEPMNPNIDTTYGGLTVDYTPKAGQVYNTEGKMSATSSGSAEYSGERFQSFTSGSTGTNGDLPAGWQVWGTDDNYIYIISTSHTSKALTLQNYTGYNNGVTLLDNICDTCFTDKTTYPESSAQNLKLEQVLAVMSSSAEPETAYNTAPYPYHVTFAWPIIWADHEQSKNNSQNNRSKAYGYVANNTSAGTKQAGTSGNVSPYYTLWYNTSLNSSSYWKTGANSTNYQTIVFKDGYWLSSRYVQPSGSSRCNFGLQFVGSSGVSWNNLYWYSNGSSGAVFNSGYVRPVVSFPRSMYELDTSSAPAKIVKK